MLRFPDGLHFLRCLLPLAVSVLVLLYLVGLLGLGTSVDDLLRLVRRCLHLDVARESRCVVVVQAGPARLALLLPRALRVALVRVLLHPQPFLALLAEIFDAAVLLEALLVLVHPAAEAANHLVLGRPVDQD